MDERTLERFLAKVDKQTKVTSPFVSTPCWLWTASARNGGYGVLRTQIDGRWSSSVASRLAHAHWNNDPIEGLIVCHRCDTPSCVNPEHLFLGTHQDNISDMWEKGRGARGDDHGQSKLTTDRVLAIRRRYSEGETQEELGEEFCVSIPTISRIVHGHEWSHVEGPLLNGVSVRRSRGVQQHLAKLTPEKVLEIRHRHEAGETQTCLGEEFGVDVSTIGNVVRGETWSHVGGPIRRPLKCKETC
jgi:hypothetical protein